MKPLINIIVLSPIAAWAIRILDIISVIYLGTGTYKVFSTFWNGWSAFWIGALMITASYIMSKLPRWIYVEKKTI